MRLEVVKISTDTMRRIDAGAEQGMRDMVAGIKARMKATGGIPVHYKDEGKWLSQLLGRTGLNPYTESGRLSDAWNIAVDSVKVDTRYRKIVLNLLNTRTMNEKTKWLGLSDNPENSFKRKNKRRTDKVRGNSDWISHKYLGARGRGAASVVQDGYRPMPTGKGFKWIRNPFPGYGYWKTYNDGYIGQGINYEARPFINRAFNNILSNKSTALVFADSPTLSLSRQLISELTTHIAKRIG